MINPNDKTPEEANKALIEYLDITKLYYTRLEEIRNMLNYKQLEARDQIEELEDVLEYLKVKMDKRKDKGKKPKKIHLEKVSIVNDLIKAYPDVSMLHSGTLKELEEADRIDEITTMFEDHNISYRQQKELLELLFGKENSFDR